MLSFVLSGRKDSRSCPVIESVGCRSAGQLSVWLRYEDACVLNVCVHLAALLMRVWVSQKLYLSVQLRRPFPAACFLVVARPLARPLLLHPLGPGVSSCGRPGGSWRVHPGCGQVAGRGRWRHDRGRGDVDRYGVLPGARAASRHGRARGLDCARVAMAEIITTIALPSVPPVSRFSRKLTNSIWSRPSSSNTSKKWRVERASRSEAQTTTTWKRPRRASTSNRSKAGRFTRVPLTP